ncbi:MAG: DEAD/DEAH box helicase [Candidatus Aenigmatarchaeota archaeon]
MDVNELHLFGISRKTIEKIGKKIKKLYPFQEEALKNGLLENSYVISAPTNSGKTLLAILAIDKVLQENKKVVYIVPLVSLANEKYEELKEIFEDKKVAISVGDYDSSDPFLAFYDIIVCTSEKLDSLIRHEASWIKDVGLFVIDEIHLLNDFSRGPTLEFLIAKLKELTNAKFLALSATIKNIEEIAKWLKAKYLITDFRPVKLYEGVLFSNKIYLNNFKKIKLNSKSLEEFVEFILSKNKQVLIFVSTRKEAEALAKRLSEITKKFAESDLNEISKEVLNVLEVPTEQCKLLSELVKRAIAFHHAGLLYKQRKIIEDAFKNKKLKVIVSTTTLSMGLNLPAFCVIIANYKRYREEISVLEYKQMVGRAGRVPYDNFGLGLIYAKTPLEAKKLFRKYVAGEIEEITSKIGNEIILRSQILSLIANNFCNNEKSLEKFFKKTFFFVQTKNLRYLREKIKEIIKLLDNWNFIIKKENYETTRIGKRVSELYIDPLSAKILLDGLENLKKDISFLILISLTTEMKFLLNVKEKEYEKIIKFYYENKQFFPIKAPEEYEIEFEYILPSLKVSMILFDWINELSEDEIMKKYGVTPGELRNIVEIADWILYSLHELALLKGKMEILKEIKKMRIRVKYGIKEELLPLIRLEGIGRARARKLYLHGIKSIETLRKIPYQTLAIIIGPKIAEKIKKQVSEEDLNQKILKEFGFKFEEVE